MALMAWKRVHAISVFMRPVARGGRVERKKGRESINDRLFMLFIVVKVV